MSKYLPPSYYRTPAPEGDFFVGLACAILLAIPVWAVLIAMVAFVWAVFLSP